MTDHLFLPDIPGANRSQNARLASVNDQYGVTEWRVESGTIRGTADDGDRFEIPPSGTLIWESVAS